MNLLKAYQPHEPVIFVHVPKCAGTSFIRLLRRWYAEGYRHPHQDESQDILLPKIQTQTASGEWDPTVRVIHAHWDHGRGYGLPYYCPEVTQYFTIVRDPFEMIVSMYFFVKGKSARGEFRYRGQTIDLRERYPSVNHYLDEEQGWVTHHLPIDLTVDNIAAKVAERFVYLGRFDQIQTSIDHLAFVLGQRQQTLPQHNVSQYDEQVPESRREEIYQRYPLMKKLYDYAALTYQVPGFDRKRILPALPAMTAPQRSAPKFRSNDQAARRVSAENAAGPASRTDVGSWWGRFWKGRT